MDEELRRQMARFESCVLNRDVATAHSVLDDDYALVLVAPTCSRMPRQRWLDVLPDYYVDQYQVEEVQTDVEADAAMVIQRVSMTATVLGQDRSGTFVITDCWRRRGQGWRVWRRHSTPLSAGPLPGAQ